MIGRHTFMKSKIKESFFRKYCIQNKDQAFNRQEQVTKTVNSTLTYQSLKLIR